MEVVPGLHWIDRIWDTKVYVLVEQGRVVLIDAATPGRAGAVWRYLESMGYQPQDLDELWITHGDIDHMGSASAIQAGSGARVVAHRADVPLVEGSADRKIGDVPLSGMLQPAANWAVRRLVRYQPAAVDQPVEEGDNLGGWRVIHSPGHTPGSTCFYNPERKLIIVGDAINYKLGRLGAPPVAFTYDMGQAFASIQKIAALDFEVCCFGHGPPLLKDAGQRVRAFAKSLPA